MMVGIDQAGEDDVIMQVKDCIGRLRQFGGHATCSIIPSRT